MKTYFLCYDSCAMFEIILLSYLMKTKSEVKYTSIDKKPIVAYEGFHMETDISLEDTNFSKGDLFVIPGGNIEPLVNSKAIKNTLDTLIQKEIYIAAICAGVKLLAVHNIITKDMDVMENKQDIVINDKFSLARPNAYIDFAIETAKLFNIYENEDDYLETIRFFKKGSY